MENLAKLNGCKNSDEFGKKFNHIGDTVKVSNTTSLKPNSNASGFSSLDALKIDTSKLNLTAQADSTRVAKGFLFDSTKVDSTKVLKNGVLNSNKTSQSWSEIQKNY
jgi:hypothetical protein